MATAEMTSGLPVAPDERLISAALRCVARWGVAKTSFEDIAQEAGCSRATVYRSFQGGKDSLFTAVVRSEVDRLEQATAGAVAETDNLEDAVVATITTVARHLADHAALRFVMAHEPGLVLPHLAFHELDTVLSRASAIGGRMFSRFLPSEEESGRLAEWIARIVISHTCSPSATVQLTDSSSVRRLVRAFVLPGLPVTA